MRRQYQQRRGLKKLILVVSVYCVLLSLAAFCGPTPLWGQKGIQKQEIQTVPEVEDLFGQGVQHYRAGDYAAAYEVFSRLVDYEPPHQRITASLLMEGRTLYKLDHYQEAITELRRLVSGYPSSRYLAGAHFVMGNSFYRLGSFREAVSNWLWVSENGDAGPLADRCQQLAASVMEHDLNLDDLRALRANIRGERALGLVTLELALAEFRAGASRRGISVLEKYAEEHPDSPLMPRVREILSNPALHVTAAQRVGVVLPLTGFYSEQGTAILRGMNFALMEGRENNHAPLGLEVRDSQGRMVPTLQATEQLCEDPDVIAIIGELESALTAGMAAVSDDRGVPHLAPVSDEVGLTELGPYVFQVNPDLVTKATALARYAYEEMGLRTFATLSPTEHYGLAMTEAFSAEIDRLGGKIVAQTWYYEDALDVRRQLKQVREAGLRLALADSLSQTGEDWDKARIDSLWEEMNQQYLEDSDKEVDMVDSDEIAVQSIDAVFLPVLSSQEIAYVAPQLAGVRIEAQILGGDYWNDLETLRGRQIRPHVNGVVFVSGSYWDEESPEYRRFRRNFRLSMGTTPTKWDMSGYDAVRLLLDSLKGGAHTREGVRQSLASIDGFQGVQGEVSFHSDNRINSKVYILQFRDGNLYKLK